MTLEYVYSPVDILGLIQTLHESDNLGVFQQAEKLSPLVGTMPGQKLRHLIAELVNRLPPEMRYLEIGTISPEMRDSVGVKSVKSSNMAHVDIIDGNYKRYFTGLDLKPLRDVGAFFFDGMAEYRSHINFLMQASRVMCPGGVVLIDDANFAHVRYATYDFIETNTDFKLGFETFTHAHPNDMHKSKKRIAERAWYNGVQVLIYDPEDRVESLNVTRDDETNLIFAKAVTQTPATCPGMPTLFAVQE